MNKIDLTIYIKFIDCPDNQNKKENNRTHFNQIQGKKDNLYLTT